jgi:restriction system protein
VEQQYGTNEGTIDILAISRDGRRLLVVELKRGRASDVVVGQILRYMGYVKEQIAEPHQTVEGAIIALEDDQKLR